MLALEKLEQAMQMALVALEIRAPEHPDTEAPISEAAVGSYVFALRQYMHSMQSKLVKVNDEVATYEKCKRLLQLCPEGASLLKQVLSMSRCVSQLTDRVHQATKDIDLLWPRMQDLL